MSLFLKDVAFDDHEKEFNKLYPNSNKFYPAEFNACLHGFYNQYLKYEKVINRLSLSDEKRKQYQDSNLILFIAQNKMISNYILSKNDNTTIDIIDDCIFYGNTVFGNINPDMKFLKTICKKAELAVEKVDSGLTFSIYENNNKKGKKAGK